MKKTFDLFKVSWTEGRGILYNFTPQRGVRFQETLKWVKPEKYKIYHPARAGDLVSMPKYFDSPIFQFNESKEFQTADEKIKKVLSLKYQPLWFNCLAYQNELVEKVRNHPFDDSSLEVKIAKLTAQIRYYQKIMSQKPSELKRKGVILSKLIGSRTKKLKYLRRDDYKKFEWLLDVLEIEYKPEPVPNEINTRKKSLTRLAQLKVENAKEEKLAALKKSLDEQKVPFLEKKIATLKDIQEKERKYNLPETVTQSDIEDCVKLLERVKIEVAERAKWGYRRKIHPFFLEPYNEKLLLAKEKAAEELREEIQRGKEDQSSS